MTIPLYDLVALGLTAHARASFRISQVGTRFELDPSGLIVSTHRSDTDVPVIISTVYRQAHGLIRTGRQLHFAVRDDLYLRGFFAGYPPGLSSATRRLLFPIGIGPILRAGLPCCHQIRSGQRMRIVELLRDHPRERFAELIPEQLARPFHERGLPRSARATDALHGRYADLLWSEATDAELCGSLAQESWSRRRAAAHADFRSLVELVRGGGTLLIFPEGRPSPDGRLGPVQPGLAALVRRAKPATVRTVALAYDPLVLKGRPLAYVGVGEPAAPLADLELLAQLRRATPLTAGQLIATGGGEAEIQAALEEGRPVAPELLDPERRRRRLAEARVAAAGRDLDRLALEFRSARA